VWLMDTTRGIDCVRLSLAPAVGGFWCVTLFLSAVFFRFKSLRYNKLVDDMGMFAFLFVVLILSISILALREPPLCPCATSESNDPVGFATGTSTPYCFAPAKPTASSLQSLQQLTSCAKHDNNISWTKEDHASFASSTVEACSGSSEPTNDNGSGPQYNSSSIGVCDSIKPQEISSVCSLKKKQLTNTPPPPPPLPGLI
jgi:hypothetical protein